MKENALELIESARIKACTLYAKDKIASPLIKTIDLVERVVNGEAHDSALEGDVQRLIDEADYTRERDANRDEPLRSLIIDICKIIGLATRVISSASSSNAQEDAPIEAFTIPTPPNKDTAVVELVIPKEEPIHDTFTAASSSNGANDELSGNDAAEGPLDQGEQYPLFSDGPGFSGTSHGRPSNDSRTRNEIKTEMDEWMMDMFVGDLLDSGEKLPNTKKSKDLKRLLEGLESAPPSSSRPKRLRYSPLERSHEERECNEDEAEEEDNAEEHNQDDEGDSRSNAVLKRGKLSKSTSGTLFNCSQCARQFPTLRGAQTHEGKCRVKGTDLRPGPYSSGHFPCAKCDKKFQTLHGLQTHEYVHKKDGLFNDGKFACPKCDRRFQTVHGLQTHDFVHNRAVNCTMCPSVVKMENIKKHMAEQHGISAPADTVKVLVADGESGTEGSKWEVQPSEEFSCMICAVKCVNQTHLDGHMRTHKIEGPYACPHCARALSSAKLRRRHIKNIHNREPYECATCSQQFAKRETLEYHLRTEENHISLMEDV
ncbi:hypothetical protein PMAYCL1PPCAC_01053 [Pristionchus mayeri]|uniref:C2H2-type domain-containing protein n=1 Tax=Pristionchus mayeri TaxID=1317129 RepID=A0AAN5BZB4_9BILA|nr:hypothetical protein PMAYCL1PPCAC_01053 [Pristionchus mayeri]